MPRSRTVALRNALHDARQPIIFDTIISPTAVPAPTEQTPILHHPQVFRGHVTVDLARLRKIAHGAFVTEKHIDHPQPMRVRERS